MIRATAFLLGIIFTFWSLIGVAESGNKVVRYCIDPDWLPYEAIINHQHVGISRDYLDYISAHSNLVFSLVETDSWSHTLDAVQQGSCDIIPMLNTSTSRQQYLNFTVPFFQAPNVLLTRISDDAIPGMAAIGQRVIGLVSGYRSSEYVNRFYTNLNTRSVSTEKQGLLLLSSGEIDVMLCSLYSANAMVSELGLDNVTISGYADTHDAFAVGIVKSKPELVTQLNNVLQAIPENKNVEIHKRWNKVQPVTKINNNWTVASIAALLTAIGTALGLRARQQRIKDEVNTKEQQLVHMRSLLEAKNRTLALLSTQDELTKLNNKNYMLQKVEEEITRFNRFGSSMTLIIVYLGIQQDTVNVKESATHPRTMSLLVELADIIMQTTRDVDIAARWSDNEIAILCPQTSEVSAQILAERMLTEIEIRSIQSFQHTHVAIGIGMLAENEDFAALHEKTINAMKNAKKRNVNGFELANTP